MYIDKVHKRTFHREHDHRNGKWLVADARNHIAELLESCVKEPQIIYRHNRKVAVVVNGHDYDAFKAWKDERSGRTVGHAFNELREICEETGWEFPEIGREDRPNAFLEMMNQETRKKPDAEL